MLIPYGDLKTIRSLASGPMATGQGVGSLSFTANKKIILTSAQPDGSVSRLIEFHAGSITERPWQSWFDHNNRHVVAVGAHDTLPVSEGSAQLKQFEVKTVADANGTNPGELRTRLAIQYDRQRIIFGHNFTDSLEVNQGENPVLTDGGPVQFGLNLRAVPQDTAVVPNAIIGQFNAQLDASDNALGFIDIKPPYVSGGTLFPGNKTATLNFFRNTTTSSASSPQIAVKKGDGTNTNSLLFTAKTGKFELPLSVSTATAIVLGGDATLYRSAAATLKTDGIVIGDHQTSQASLTTARTGGAAAALPAAPVKYLALRDETGARVYVPAYS